MLDNFINTVWYKNSFLGWLLSPFMVIYLIIVFIRQWLYQKKILTIHKIKVPVIVVGNITVGGTGKTPIVIWLANYLCNHGFKPGIVSRGYGADRNNLGQAILVEKNMDASTVGDEPLLIFLRTCCPVVVSKDRVLAAKELLANYDCDIIISDDGLQHYALGRDLEIVLIDGLRYFGNGLCLPSGPLREPRSRLKKADVVLINGNMLNHNAKSDRWLLNGKVYNTELIPEKFCNVYDNKLIKELIAFQNKTVHGVAAIGNPKSFFSLLRSLGFNVIEHVFPDHYAFKSNDIIFEDDLLVIMTEKDAVKCKKLINEALNYKYWFLRVEAQPNVEFINQVNKWLNLERRKT